MMKTVRFFGLNTSAFFFCLAHLPDWVSCSVPTTQTGPQVHLPAMGGWVGEQSKKGTRYPAGGEGLAKGSGRNPPIGSLVWPSLSHNSDKQTFVLWWVAFWQTLWWKPINFKRLTRTRRTEKIDLMPKTIFLCRQDFRIFFPRLFLGLVDFFLLFLVVVVVVVVEVRDTLFPVLEAYHSISFSNFWLVVLFFVGSAVWQKKWKFETGLVEFWASMKIW